MLRALPRQGTYPVNATNASYPPTGQKREPEEGCRLFAMAVRKAKTSKQGGNRKNRARKKSPASKRITPIGADREPFSGRPQWVAAVASDE